MHLCNIYCDQIRGIWWTNTFRLFVYMMANLELVSKMAEFGPDSGGRVKVNNSDPSLCVSFACILRLYLAIHGPWRISNHTF